METIGSAARRKVTLFVIGTLIGVVGVVTYGRYFFTGHVSGAVAQVLRDKGGLALACTPKSSDDEFFFVSCGGIY